MRCRAEPPGVAEPTLSRHAVPTKRGARGDLVVVEARDDVVRYRLQRANEALEDARVLANADDLEDLHQGLERLQDPADALLDWEEVRRGLLDQD